MLAVQVVTFDVVGAPFSTTNRISNALESGPSALFSNFGALKMSDSGPDLTPLFARMRHGDADAVNGVMNALYTELHHIAARHMRGEARQHTLQPTALVNEAYLRLMHGPDVVHNRQHFLALAAQAMRRVLVDHARQKRARKRGGGLERVTLELLPGEEPYNVDVLALDEALTALSKLDERASRVVELRFFGGHTDKEVCEILGENLPTVRRDWVFARSWLKTRFHPVSPG
jgi:RNA polymerase sigma factor (TIGR02999 family)